MQFTNWADTDSYLSRADNLKKGELFELITERFLKWSPKYFQCICVNTSKSYS